MAPATLCVQQRVVAWVVVVVGDYGVEHHAEKQFASVVIALYGPATKFICQQRVRPAVTANVAIFGVNHRQARHEPVAPVLYKPQSE